MNRRPGQTPNPFANVHDKSLYVETARLGAARQKALKLLSGNQGLWISGPPGSGRTSLVLNLAGHLESDGFFTVLAGPGGPPLALGVIGRLYLAIFGEPPPPSHIDACENVYAELLKNLWHGDTVVLLADPYTGGSSGGDELELLTKLDFMGKPLAKVVCCGEGPPPLDSMAVLPLLAPDERELALVMGKRMELMGQALLSSGEIDILAGKADGFSMLMDLAFAAFRRKGTFMSREAAQTSAVPGVKSEVLSREMVEEVGRLLEAISLDGADGAKNV